MFMDRRILSTAGLFGMTAIILGAFGAHALKKLVTLEQLTTFETGIKYQMYHALFLLFLGINNHLTPKTKKIILNFTIFGVIFFSGSIYLLATNPLMSFDFKIIGFLTPIGGLLLILAWGTLIFNFVKKKS